MRRVSDIVAVLIFLKVRSEPVLGVLLANDGTINRMGTGSIDNSERSLFIGQTEAPLLPQLLAHLKDEMLDHTGAYDIKEKKGAPCQLSISLKFGRWRRRWIRLLIRQRIAGPTHTDR
jgi:hypothetical protein